LTLGDRGKMKLDTDLFPIGMVELMDKKVFVHTDQVETTKGKNVVVSDELRNRMIKAHNPEIGMWKESVMRKPAKRVKPTSAMLIEKYQWQLEEDRRYQVTRGTIQDRFFNACNRSDLQVTRHGGEP
jgi:predicted double-glycine peptidase